MDLKEFLAKTTEIAQNLNNQARVTEILTELQEDYETLITTQATLSEQLQKSQQEIESLRKTNMNLYLKQAKPVETEDGKLNDTKPLSYDDVVKSLGGE